jgi:hypothetical protein
MQYELKDQEFSGELFSGVWIVDACRFALYMLMLVFRVVTLCGLEGRCQYFGSFYWLHLKGLNVLSVSSELKIKTVYFSETLVFT